MDRKELLRYLINEGVFGKSPSSTATALVSDNRSSIDRIVKGTAGDQAVDNTWELIKERLLLEDEDFEGIAMAWLWAKEWNGDKEDLLKEFRRADNDYRYMSVAWAFARLEGMNPYVGRKRKASVDLAVRIDEWLTRESGACQTTVSMIDGFKRQMSDGGLRDSWFTMAFYGYLVVKAHKRGDLTRSVGVSKRVMKWLDEYSWWHETQTEEKMLFLCHLFGPSYCVLAFNADKERPVRCGVSETMLLTFYENLDVAQWVLIRDGKQVGSAMADFSRDGSTVCFKDIDYSGDWENVRVPMEMGLVGEDDEMMRWCRAQSGDDIAELISDCNAALMGVRRTRVMAEDVVKDRAGVTVRFAGRSEVRIDYSECETARMASVFEDVEIVRMAEDDSEAIYFWESGVLWRI